MPAPRSPGAGRAGSIEACRLCAADSIPDLTRLLHRAHARLAAMGLRYMATHQPDEVTRECAASGECTTRRSASGWVAWTASACSTARRCQRSSARTPRVRHMFFGHLHRAVAGSWRGVPFSGVRGTNRQIALDFVTQDVAPVSFEAPGYGVVLVSPEAVVVHFEEVAASVRREPA